MDGLFEFGLQPFMTLKITEIFFHRVRQNVNLYQSLEELVSDATSKVNPNVKMDNVLNLFLYFGGFLVLVLFLFIVEKFLFKQLQTVSFKLVFCPIILVHFGWLWIRTKLFFNSRNRQGKRNLLRNSENRCFRM